MRTAGERRCGDQNMQFCGTLHGGADRATVEDGQPRIPDVVDVPRRQRLGKLNMTIPLTDPFMTPSRRCRLSCMPGASGAGSLIWGVRRLYTTHANEALAGQRSSRSSRSIPFGLRDNTISISHPQNAGHLRTCGRCFNASAGRARLRAVPGRPRYPAAISEGDYRRDWPVPHSKRGQLMRLSHHMFSKRCLFD